MQRKMADDIFSSNREAVKEPEQKRNQNKYGVNPCGFHNEVESEFSGPPVCQFIAYKPHPIHQRHHSSEREDDQADLKLCNFSTL